MSTLLQGLSAVACAAPQLGVATMPTADIQDMQAVCSGDEQAFKRVIRRHQHQLMAYCFRLTSDESTAQDIIQEVFLTLWKQRNRYTEQGKLKFYLLRIARLRSLAHLKKSRAKRLLEEKAREIRVSQPLSSRAFDDSEVQAALKRLRSKQRDLIVLRHFEGFELAEIRSITGLRIGTIKSRLHRAMAALRTELEDDR